MVMKKTLLGLGFLSIVIFGGSAARASEVPKEAMACLEKGTTTQEISAKYKDSQSVYYVVTFTSGEIGGQNLIVVTGSKCKQLGGDNSVFPLSQWGTPRKVVKGLMFDWAKRDIASHGGLAVCQKYADRYPDQFTSLDSEQIEGYRAAGLKIPSK